MGKALLALAAGLGSGYMRQEETNRRNKMEDEDRAFQTESRDRTRNQWADDDSLKSDIKEGDRVFSDTIKSFDRPQLSQAAVNQDPAQAPQMSQDPTMVDQPDAMGRPIPKMSRAPQTLSLAQTSGAQPAPAAPSLGLSQAGAVPTMGKGGKPGLMNQEAPDPRVLAAMQAKTNHFLSKGRVDQYKQSWMETSQLRAQLRSSEFAGADKEYALSGDPTVYAKRIYPLIADGHDLVDSKVVPGQDGKPYMAITRRDQTTGEESTVQTPVDKFMRTVEIARDPAAVLASEAAYAKKLFETNEEIRKEKAKLQAKGVDDRETESLKGQQKLEAIRLEKGLEGGNAISLASFKAKNGDGSNGKAPAGYRFTSEGDLKAIPGGPADKSSSPGKPLPISAANGVLTNQQNLRRAQTALALVSGNAVDGATGDTDATGKKGWLPNQFLNRIDPAGVDTRAAIADLGSLVIHDRSGAAVTASEFPRLAPFIPTEKDDAATVKKKLTMFVKNYQALLDDQTEFYRSSGYNVPVEKLKAGTGDSQTKPSTSQSQTPRAATPAEAMKLPPGTVFIDANGVTRRRP